MNHSKHIKLVNCYQTPIKLIQLMKSEKELMPLFLHLNYMLFLWFSSKSVFESLIYPEINCSVAICKKKKGLIKMPFDTSTRLYSLLAERIKFPIRKEKRSDTICIKPMLFLWQR